MSNSPPEGGSGSFVVGQLKDHKRWMNARLDSGHELTDTVVNCTRPTQEQTSYKVQHRAGSCSWEWVVGLLRKKEKVTVGWSG